MAELQIIAVIGKLRPKVERGRRVTLDDLADEIAVQSGFDRGDARDFAYKFSQGLSNHLKYGDSVQLGEIGSFAVSCDKDKKLRVTYRASNAMNGQLNQEFLGKFTNGANTGLDDEGYAALWLEQNPGDTVIMRDGSPRTATP